MRTETNRARRPRMGLRSLHRTRTYQSTSSARMAMRSVTDGIQTRRRTATGKTHLRSASGRRTSMPALHQSPVRLIELVEQECRRLQRSRPRLQISSPPTLQRCHRSRRRRDIPRRRTHLARNLQKSRSNRRGRLQPPPPPLLLRKRRRNIQITTHRRRGADQATGDPRRSSVLLRRLERNRVLVLIGFRRDRRPAKRPNGTPGFSEHMLVFCCCEIAHASSLRNFCCFHWHSFAPSQ